MGTMKMKKWVAGMAGLLCLAGSVAHANNDIVIADFEGDTYGNWTTEGTAFGTRPARANVTPPNKVTGHQGAGLVNTYLGGDKATGTLSSPEFILEREYINFLIGGGDHAGKTCMNLRVDGKRVRTAVGSALKDRGREVLDWKTWDVSEWVGKQAVLEIVDNYTGGWGHINVDSIVQSDKPLWHELELAIKVEKRYLNMPVDNSLGQKWVYVYVDGEETPDYYLELQLADPGEADFWVYMDLSRYTGKEIVLKTSRPHALNSAALDQCYQSDEPREAATFYTEEKRPQFHFSSKRGWINDVNGPVYYNGTYHLFYQHNPYGWKWGNMHWGHAVSTDLVHWVEMGDALMPDKMGTMYSGAAAVDTMNTTGFQTGAHPPIILAYTAAGDHAPVKVPRTQAIAYSTDGGITFDKFAGNPVLDCVEGFDGNRDPKIFWHEPSSRWVMVLYMGKATYAFFTSPDLKQWRKTSEVELLGDGECPDFFPLALDGDSNAVKWVLWGAGGRYLVGSFDGATFTPDSRESQSCYDGGAGYAALTYSNIPESDGRCIQISWMRRAKAFEGMPFNLQMSFPVELKLNTTAQGPRLFAWPVREVENIYAATRSFPERTLTPTSPNLLEGMDSDMQDIYAEFELINDSASFGFEIRGEEFIYHAATKEFEAFGRKVKLEPVDGKINMRILIDKMSVELFAGDGLVYMPFYLVPPEANGAMRLFTQNGSVTLKTLKVNGLDSIWN